MTRVPASLVLALAFSALSACTGGGLDIAELRAPDQRSVNDSRRVYHRPSAGPDAGAPVTDQPAAPSDPSNPPVVAGAPPGSTGWADSPDSTQPPVFAPPPPTYYEPPPAPVVPNTPSVPSAPRHTTSTLSPAHSPPRTSIPDPSAPAAGTSDADPLYLNFMGQVPPELSSDGSWVTPASASSLAGLRGSVVFLVFSFQNCEGCKIFMPTLQQWAETYQRRGATILYVDNGAVDPLDYAKKAMKENRSTYSYFHDTKANMIKSYGVRSFPTAYLLDKQGKVIWQGCPTAREAELMPLIESEMAK